MKYHLTDIVDNGQVYSPILEQFGIKTPQDLVNEVRPHDNRKLLAEKTGINEQKLLNFLHSIDLLRIKGVGILYSTLFCEAGVCSVKELGEWEAIKLYDHLTEINENQELVQHLPSIEQLEGLINQAKSLPELTVSINEEETTTPTFWSKYGTSIGMLVFGAIVVGFSMVFRRQIVAAYTGISFYNEMGKVKKQIGNLQNISFEEQINQAKAQVSSLVEEINHLRR